MKPKISIRHEIKRYALLLLFPVLFSIVLYGFVQNSTVRQLEHSAEQTLNLFYMQISSMTRETNNIALSINSDFSLLSNLSYPDAFLYSFDDPLSICRQIDIRKGDSLYIDRIYFIPSTEDDTIYSDEGYYTYSSLTTILSEIGLTTESFLNIEESYWGMYTLGNLKEPFYVIPFRNTTGELIGRLLFVISLDKFVEIISSLDTEYACLYAPDFLISSRDFGGEYSISDLSSEERVSELLGERVKCLYIENSDYTYLVAFSVWDFYLPLVWMVVSFLVYAMLVFAIGFLYLFKVSQNRYAEITTLINALPQESGAGNLSYQELVPTVQAALLDAVDLRERQQQLRKEHIFHNMLHHFYMPSVLQEYAREIGLPVSGAFYRLALFSIRKWDNIALAASSSEDSRQIAWTIFKAVAAQFEDNGIHVICDNNTDTFNALFFGDLSARPAYVEESCESICQFIQDEYGILFHAAVSSPAQELAEVPNLLAQTQKLESFSLSISGAALVISEERLRGSVRNVITGNFLQQQLALSHALLTKKYDVVPSMVASLLEEFVATAPDYNLAMSRLSAISETLAEALLTIQGTELDLDACAQRLRKINSVSELNAECESIFLQLDAITNTAPTSYPKVDAASIYIKENLGNKNLNVNMISEAVGTIPQRLIPLFQKQFNMGIAEYVNHQRIEEATRLLATTKFKVHQIADQVGYCNTDTFTRNFRKLMGVTPTEYRQIHGDNIGL